MYMHRLEVQSAFEEQKKASLTEVEAGGSEVRLEKVGETEGPSQPPLHRPREPEGAGSQQRC